MRYIFESNTFMSLHEAHRIFLLPSNYYSGDEDLTSYGHIDKFHAEDESVKAYLEQIDIYFRANDIADEKKVSIFLSVGRKNIFGT